MEIIIQTFPSLAQQVNQLGPLTVYEQNLRFADENLLREGNFSRVPSMDVLKAAGQECNNRYRLDEDMFKEVRVFREITQRLDQSSEDIQGKHSTAYGSGLPSHVSYIYMYIYISLYEQ